MKISFHVGKIMAKKLDEKQVFSGKTHHFFPGSFVCLFGVSNSGKYLYGVLY